MSDDQRRFSNEEFALILRAVAERPSGTSSAVVPSSGYSLAEMQAAAAQVGIDPADVERAARLLPARSVATPLERLIGGPVRHRLEARFRVPLSEPIAADLLSALRISAALPGVDTTGHSSALGMTWNDGGNTEALSVTAKHADSDTAAIVVLDRRQTLGLTLMMSGLGIFLSCVAGIALSDIAPAVGVAGGAAGIAGVLGIARRFWTVSTRTARERLRSAMETVETTLLGRGGHDTT